MAFKKINILPQKLHKYLGSTKLLEIYSKSVPSNDTFLQGYLIGDIEYYFIFEGIELDGSLAGYTLYAKSDIAKGVTNTNYEAITNSYVSQQKRNNAYDPFNLSARYKSIDKTTINTILTYCYKNNKIVMINSDEYDNKTRAGKVIDLDSEYVTLDQVSYYKDWGADFEVKTNKPIAIKSILTLDFISKDNYLYEQYLKQN